MGCGRSKNAQNDDLNEYFEGSLNNVAVEKSPNDHASSLLKSLNTLRNAEALCDVNLRVKDLNGKIVVVPSHKCVLASASGLFRQAFGIHRKTSQNSNASNTQKLITPVKSLFHFNGTPNFLLSIPQPVLNSILNYCYLGVIDDDIGSVETILDASIKFQMPALERDCVKILASKYNSDHFSRLYDLSNKIDSTELRRFIFDRALENLKQIVDGSWFLNLAEDQIKKLIEHRTATSIDHPPSEILFFDAITKWMEKDPTNRKEAAQRLLFMINYNKISPEDLSNIVLASNLITDDLRNFILSKTRTESNSERLSREAVSIISESSQTPRMYSSLLVIGGAHFDQISTTIERLSEHKWNWHEWNHIPSPTSHHCAAVVNNVLYVVGGQIPVLGGMKCLDTVWRYSPISSEWTSLTPMQHARSHFYLSVLQNHLFVVGGRGDNSVLASVEKLNLQTRRWEYSQLLPQECCDLAGCEHKGCIYVTGGQVRHSSSNELLKFDPGSRRWSKMSPMKCPRSNHCMAAARNKFLVFGGENITKEISHPVMPVVECYCSSNNHWHLVERKVDLHNLVDSGCAISKGRICFIGGCHSNSSDYRQCVTTYDPERDEWSRLPDFPRRVRGCACVVLKVHRSVEGNSLSPTSAS